MATIRNVETKQRKNGKPVVHYEVCWTEPAVDDQGRPIPANPEKPNGRKKVRHRSETYHTFDAAKDRKAEIEGLRNRDHEVVARSAGDRLFGEFAAAWVAELREAQQAGSLKRRTVDEYEKLLNRYALPEFGTRAVGSISRTQAKEFRSGLVNRGLSRSSVNNAFDPFRWVLDMAVDEKAIGENPAIRSQRTKRKERIRKPLPRGQVLAPEQVFAVSATISETYPVYGLMVEFVAYTGPRAGELAGLDVGDVAITAHPDGTYSGNVDIHEQRHKVNGEWESDDPKSDNSTRIVPMPDWLAEKMFFYLNNTHPHGDDPAAPLFPNRKVGGARLRGRGGKTKVVDLSVNLDWSQPINPGTFYETILKKAFRANGIAVTDTKASPPIKGVRFHDLRHTFATTALMAGVGYQRVSEWLGHSTYVVTLTIYAHWIPKDERSEINKLAAPAPAAPAPAPEAASNVVAFRPRRKLA
ncbi:site-specific integrase [Amycolatopsis sp. NPDC051106]|uniref:tyrosine-type recombinase/integrase n=1 Tax=unclassified Amycolatopsis TaxID=2618356 RepID=UPI00342896C6